MTDNEMLKQALQLACRELVYARKYGYPLPERLTPFTDAEAREAKQLYEGFLGKALEGSR